MSIIDFGQVMAVYAPGSYEVRGGGKIDYWISASTIPGTDIPLIYLLPVVILLVAVIVFVILRSRNNSDRTSEYSSSRRSSSQSDQGFWTDASWDGSLPPLVTLKSKAAEGSVRVIQPYSRSDHDPVEEAKKRMKAQQEKSQSEGGTPM